jgi:hypothetical protein
MNIVTMLLNFSKEKKIVNTPLHVMTYDRSLGDGRLATTSQEKNKKNVY